MSDNADVEQNLVKAAAVSKKSDKKAKPAPPAVSKRQNPSRMRAAARNSAGTLVVKLAERPLLRDLCLCAVQGTAKTFSFGTLQAA